MKLIFLTSRFPYPLEKGDKLRSYFFIRELSKHHEVILISLCEKYPSDDDISELARIATRVHVFKISFLSRFVNTFLAFFTCRPLQAGYFFNPCIKRKIHKIIQAELPDHIFCQLLRTALYVKGIPVDKTIDYQDVLSQGVKRRMEINKFPFSLVLQLEYKRLKKFESRIFNWFNHRIIITETDRDLMPVIDKKQIHVISNGVDIDYFDYQFGAGKEKQCDVLFTGNMGYPPNVDCAHFIAEKVLPLLKQHRPNIRVVFAGASPHSSLLKLRNENITVTGWVDEMREMYATSRVFLAPMQIGTGLQNKLLEAMAMKLPCVTSNLANSALGGTNEKNILVADEPGKICEYILKLLDDKQFAEQISENGYEYVKSRFSWSGQIENLNKIWGK